MRDWTYLRLVNGEEVIVDRMLVDDLRRFKWNRSSKGTSIMRSAGGGRQMITLGRYIMGVWPSERLRVKRKDSSREDYRRENLEVVEVRERGKMPKCVTWRVQELAFCVKFQFAKTVYEKKGFKTLEAAVKARDSMLKLVLEKNPDWPPSRNGERRGTRPEPRSLAERLWQTLEMKEID